jgi:putative membrane protein
MNRSLFIAFAGVALAAAPSLAQTTPPPPPPPPGATTTAAPFVMTAGASDLYEITSSQIALQKSQNSGVRQLAQMLITDHTKTTSATMAAANASGLNPAPPMLMPDQQQMIDQLKVAPAGADFDRLYLGQQLPAHQAALTLMEGYAKSGDKAALRRTASTAVPVIRMHIRHVQELHGEM